MPVRGRIVAKDAKAKGDTMKPDLFEILPAIPDISDKAELRLLCALHGANVRRTLALAAELEAMETASLPAEAVCSP